jgi:very-short-patch-repair endonuclease
VRRGGRIRAALLDMNPALTELLAVSGGLVRWGEVPKGVLSRAMRAGRLWKVLPGVYLDASCPQPATDLVRRAALAWADGRAALSHLTALDLWGIRPARAGEPVHLTVPTGVGLRSRPGFVVHQRDGFAPEPPRALLRDGLPVTRLERSLVDSWPLLPRADRPGPLIRSVNGRLTTPDRVGAAMVELPRLTGRAELRTLLDKLAAGCRSELEIWGHDHVFTGPGMPPLRRQVRIRVGGRICYLDVYAERERVDFELDGATTHGDPAQREIDLRRDALLATLGILVVRFAHRRLVHEPTEVRREVLSILATRGPRHGVP